MSTTTTDPRTADAPERQPSPRTKSPVVAVLKPLASLQLTVVLFALSMVLVFFGTVAMMRQGLWTAVDEYFRSFVVWIPLDLVRKFGTVFLTDVGDFPKDGQPWRGAVPFPGGWTIGFAMLINLLAAHAVRFKFSWKRSGIILLHAGVILLMVGELITGLYAVESTMTIRKGETTDFLDVTREFEIAITDSSDPALDKLTVVPHTLLMRPGTVSHPDLPFDLRVTEYWVNTDKDDLLADDLAKPGVVRDPNVIPITSVAPMIKGVRLSQRAEAAGVDSDARSDTPSVRVTALEKGTDKELGTFLLSLWAYPNFERNRRIYQFPEATVTVGGKPYTLLLRNKRVFQPYTVELLDFEHGRYAGTDIPKDFASTVRVRDKATSDGHEARIWMNNPLRYAGVSMYQHAVLFNDSGTVLQVVANPALWLPYIACTMVTLGLLVHFCIALNRWLGKPAGPVGAGALTATGRWWLPWAINGALVFLVLGWFASHLRPPPPTPEGIDLYAFGQLPVREAGRIMPLDTLARTSLQSISELTEVKKFDEKTGGTKVSATAMQWFVDALDSPTGDWRTGPGAKHQVFRIENDQVLALLGLQPRPGFFRYSVEEMRPKLHVLTAEYERVRVKRDEQKALDLFDSKIEELARRVRMYQRLASAQDVQLIPPTKVADWSALGDWDRVRVQTVTAAEREKLSTAAEEAAEEFLGGPEIAELSKKYGHPTKWPKSEQSWARDEMQARQAAVIGAYLRTQRGEGTAAGAFTELLDTARERKGVPFRTALEKYRTEYLVNVPAVDRRKAEVEAYWLDHLAPFYYAEWLYGFAAAFALIGWLLWRPLNGAAWGVMLFTFTLHAAAIGLRMWIMGRPPVTNLYASAVFIGFGCVFLSLILEAVYRNGVGNLVGALVGLATCKVAHFLGGSGDTMAMLVAVLDTNFWLTVHVLTVTTGYTGTFLAGAFASLYLLARVVVAVSRHLGLDGFRLHLSDFDYLPKMTYAILCFALLLSFFGTVSGGIWADFSWGRFWGWDPKENGAVLIVIWNALILHARWCGMVKDRGMAVLCVAGNMVTAWSWFGTNQLQIGLHSYGFDNRLASGCFWFWMSQLAVMALALIPIPTTEAKPTRNAKRV